MWTAAVMIAALLLAVGALTFVNSGGGTAGTATPKVTTASPASAPSPRAGVVEAAGPEFVVDMQGMQFSPKVAHVAPGTTVVWRNADPVEHNVVQATAATLGKAKEDFRSPELKPGEEFRWTFTEEGTVDYLCDTGGHYLAGMVGQIVVTKDAEAATAGGAGATGASEAPRIAKDPTDIPPPITRRTPTHLVYELESTELIGQLDDGMTYEFWTFNDTVPGPMLRARVGDTVEIRLANSEHSSQVHSIDLHAVTGPGGGAAVTQVAPGEEKAFQFLATAPGVYVYHCATPYIPLHIANGMYGIIVIEPEDGWGPVDHEFYVMQGDMYTDLRPGDIGHAVPDMEAMWQEIPNFVVFNGQYQALTGEHAMKAKVGDKVRIFIGNGGPNLTSSFHVIGEIFDNVLPEGASEAVSNVQTTVVAPGGATLVEFTLDVPGEFILVDHALGRAMGKGTVGILEVEGPEQPHIFKVVD